MWLGTISINDWIEWHVNTHDPTNDGAETDATGDVTYRIYEENADTAITNSTLSKRDDDNTTGYYVGRVQILAATGFEAGKRYFIRTTATVGGITGSTVHSFMVLADGHSEEEIADNIDTINTNVSGLNDLSAADVNAEVDSALSDYDPPTKTEMDNKIDGLNNLSAAQVNAECDSALADYDPPTKTELDSGLAGLNDLSAAQVNAEVDTALADYDPPTKTEMDSGFAALNDLSAAEVNAQCDTALSDYDAPTRAELTSDKNEIITDLDDIKGTGFVKDTNSMVNMTPGTAVNLQIQGRNISVEDV